MEKILIFLLLPVFLGACANTVNTYELRNSSAQSGQTAIIDRRVITDASLASDIEVLAIDRIIENGLLKIQLKLHNSSNENKQINYKFTFFDKNGIELPSVVGAWKTAILEGGETVYVSAISDHKNADNFSLKIMGDVREY